MRPSCSVLNSQPSLSDILTSALRRTSAISTSAVFQVAAETRLSLSGNSLHGSIFLGLSRQMDLSLYVGARSL